MKIASIKASMNLGLSERLSNSFKVIPVDRPIVSNQKIPSPFWLAGFVCGDGSFLVAINKTLRTKSGFQVRLSFSVGQHIRDINLMKSFCNYLSYGYIVKKESKDFVEFRVSNFTDIESVIIPFFWKIPSLCG